MRRGRPCSRFPELGLSGYSIEDLFHQQALLDAVRDALEQPAAPGAAELSPVLVVGAPLALDGAIYNTAVVIHRGRILGVVPKSYLPEYREYYEKRQFRAARDAVGTEIELGGPDGAVRRQAPVRVRGLAHLTLHVEICEDVWAPIPPSSFAAMAGATVVANLSASNITVGKADWRRVLCQAHSGRTITGYIYTAAGEGESTTDLAWDGQALICENGDLITEAERFATEEQLIFADIDLDRIVGRPRQLQRVRRRGGRPPGAPRRASAGSASRSSRRAAARRSLPLRRHDRALPVRPRRPGQPPGALRGGLQHPGPRAGDPAAGDRHREDRDRRLRRPGLHPCPDRRRAGDGPPRPAARQRARLHDARLRHQPGHAARTRTG